MLFNSVNFAIFLPVVFFLYWFVANRSLRSQNILLLIASYFFYASWDYRFLFLLILSTCLDYYSGIKIFQAGSKKTKLFWLWLSICINLGFLALFKYYNFFSSSFANLVTNFGFDANFVTLNVILPVGISFYTFHGLSYILDTYYDRIKPETNLIDYSVFVSFFPLLVAGPIERATHLLPQIKQARRFNYTRSIDGLRQILWGLFKKIVIADNAARFADNIFDQPGAFGGSTLLLGAVFFAIQIYCDFSGYSDIALGTARLFGIDLLRNFAFPYFSRNIAEFWRRWHISLSSWFRDYVYIPLGGSQVSTFKKIRNVFIIFLLSGLWHGANWTFLIWGLLNALYILPSVLAKTNRNYLNIVAAGRHLPSGREFFSICLTFFLTVIAWIFFRSNTVGDAFVFMGNLFSVSLLSLPQGSAFLVGNISVVTMLSLVGFFFLIEWVGREQQYAIARLGYAWPKPIRWVAYYSLLFTIFYFGGSEKQFIYFQF